MIPSTTFTAAVAASRVWTCRGASKLVQITSSSSSSFTRRSFVTTRTITVPFSPSLSSSLQKCNVIFSQQQQQQPVIPQRIIQQSRYMSTLSESDIKKRLDTFQDLFVEARLCIEDANESAGTKYYEEDVQAAIDCVNEAVAAFEALVNDVTDLDEKNRILRGNGLKVEQLKGELEMALHGGHDH